ncbi:cupin domain-containing protein [Rhizobiaceae bacterium]|nr:cupin domain-containing protein [Rhizobiaceae bacterium]
MAGKGGGEQRPTYILRADEIAAMDGVSKAHFLNANARRVNKNLGDLTGLAGFGFHLIEVEPGCETTEYHLHHHEDECVFVLDGEATATIGDEEQAIGSGDFIGYRKGGLAHSIRNTGNRTLRCIVVGERLPHDVGDYPNQRKRIYRNAGLPWAVVDHDAIVEPKNVGKK